MFGLLRRRPPHRETAGRLYAALAAQARMPAFFAGLGVPDTVDGRFDVLALHAWMVIDRVRSEPGGDAIAQAVFDAMFGHPTLPCARWGAGSRGRPADQGLAEGP
jgi:cytochrome b pre-mRNA-processing protein 3